MDFFGAIFSSLLSIIFFCMIIAGVMKLFQIATLLGEIKDALLSQRHQNIVQPAAMAQERPAPPSAQWTPAPPAEYPSYSRESASPGNTALETVPRVLHQSAPQPMPATQAYLSPSTPTSPSEYQPVHPQEAIPATLDEKMSGEQMLRALDEQMRAEEARRASSNEAARRASLAEAARRAGGSAPTVIDTTIVTPHD